MSCRANASGTLGALLEAAPDDRRESTPPGALPLDLHKESSDPGRCRCDRWPSHLALRDQSGEQIRGRCSSPNKCEACSTLAAIENTEVLALDAMTNAPPLVWAVLTTPQATLATEAFYRAREQLQKALRRRWPSCEYVALVEFTTGHGERSGGLRRPHWNLLWKGIPAEDVALVREVVERVWCARVGASPKGQYVDSIENAGGVMRYIALHFQKSSQRPPAGWKGHRFLHSRGYFAAAMPEIRAQAREALARKRTAWRVEKSLPAGVHFDPLEVEDWIAQAYDRNRARRFHLVQLHDELGPVLSKPPGRAVRRG